VSDDFKEGPTNTPKENGGNGGNNGNGGNGVESSKPSKPALVDPLTAPAAPRRGTGSKATTIRTDYVPPPDAVDLAGLYQDRGQGDPLATRGIHHIPVGKPRGYFMIPENAAFRRLMNVFFLKREGSIEEKVYLVTDEMLDLLEGEARPAIMTTCVARDGTIRIWPIKQPREGEADNIAWSTAMDVAREAMKGWVRLKWIGGRYESRKAPAGYAKPDFTKLIPLDEQLQIAFREQDIIRDEDHIVYRVEVLGEIEDEDDDGEDGET
jgi:hypothetical protein